MANPKGMTLVNKLIDALERNAVDITSFESYMAVRKLQELLEQRETEHFLKQMGPLPAPVETKPHLRLITSDDKPAS